MGPGARALLVAALLAAAAVPAHAVDLPSPGCLLAPKPAVGISEVSRTAPAERVLDVVVRSEAMGGNQHVNVLLPPSYDASGATRYPVLYLLHGAFGTYTDWLANGAKDLIGDRPFIVVMPDDGADGSYSDWYGSVAGTMERAPAWETYHVKELVPFIDATFPTAADRAHRFIAGSSSGGHGAMKYAAIYPQLFGAAGEFSGAVDTNLSHPIYPTVSEALWGTTLYYRPVGHCTWGDPYTQEVVWRDNNPTYLAANLRGVALYLATGNGNGGELDSGDTFDPTEWAVGLMNTNFAAALDAAKLPHTDYFYGDGTHTWPYWKRDFTKFLAWLDPQVGTATAPETFDYRSAREHFAPWGWSFTTHRDSREFVYLDDVSATGFTVSGSGTLDLVTPAGLHLTVDLGPSHAVQQTDFSSAPPDGWTTKHVTIAPG
jgi:S-formylglutathione hydrolase FrmB